MRSRGDDFGNLEIVVVALQLAGGGKGPVDTEDVAVRANELVPGHFVWKKYPDQINIETVRVFLSDAKKEKYGALVQGSGREGWSLTKEGLAFARKLRKKVSKGTPELAERLTPREKTWRRAERARLLATDACSRFEAEGENGVTAAMAEEFFRIDEYVSGGTRDRKIVRLIDAFGEDPELGPVVRALALKVRVT